MALIETIRALVESLSGHQTVWRDRPRPFVNPTKQALVLLQFRNARGLGIDDRQQVDLGVAIPNPPLEMHQHGQRLRTLDVRVESFDHEDGKLAVTIAEALRTKLWFLSSLATLRAEQCALSETREVADVSNFVQDDRVTSAASLEVVLGLAIEDTDPTKIQSIETVDVQQV